MASIAYRTVEFHRFGSSEMLLKPENRYIRTTGWDSVAQEVSPGLDHREFLRSLNALRYDGVASDRERLTARNLLAAEAARFLDGVQPLDGQLLQVDLVTNAAELWAFPFEACFGQKPDWLKSDNAGVVVTRRIRGDFSENAVAWPVTPKVLFLHAPVTRDLQQSLIDEHVAALTDALRPWTAGKDVFAANLLTVREVRSVRDVVRTRAEIKPAYIHVLAHGAPAPSDPLLPQEIVWGLRLGQAGEPGIAPGDVAEALQPIDGFPLVVTVAACDSANQANPVFATHSVVQELHRSGVPIVIGSQLPLTKPGSTVLCRSFYSRLLQGDDARVALHVTRIDLNARPEAANDWLSLVGYVRLPPVGYAAYLDEVGLRMELRMLDAAQKSADFLNAEGGTLAEFDGVELLLLRRLESLNVRRQRLAGRPDLLEECSGLEASSLKRLAELRFLRGLRHPEFQAQAADWQSSKDALSRSLVAYRTAYEANLQSHWLGVQQLALEAALTGTIKDSGDWSLVARAAELRGAQAARANREDYWSCGTLAELALLAPCAGRVRDLEKAKAAAELLVARARRAGEEFAIASTRRQIARYVSWWTREHGFFPSSKDLSDDALELLNILR